MSNVDINRNGKHLGIPETGNEDFVKQSQSSLEDRTGTSCRCMLPFTSFNLADIAPRTRNADMHSLGRAARSIHRVIGPFKPIAPTILQGIDLEYRQKMHPHIPAECVLSIFIAYIQQFHNHPSHRISEEDELQLGRYQKIVTAIPGLDKQVQYTMDYCAPGLVHLAAFVSARYRLLSPAHLSVSSSMPAAKIPPRTLR